MSPSSIDHPLSPEQLQQQETKASKEGYIHQVLVAFDQFWNVAGGRVLGSRGLPDETISAHTRRVVDDPHAKHKLLAKVLNHLLDEIQPNHGALAEAGDLERAKTVADVETRALNTPR